MPYLKNMTDKQFARYCGGMTAKIIYPISIAISIIFVIGWWKNVEYPIESIVSQAVNMALMMWSAWRRPNGRHII